MHDDWPHTPQAVVQREAKPRYYVVMSADGQRVFLDVTGLPYTDRQIAYDDAQSLTSGLRTWIVYNLVEVARFGPEAYAINLKEE